MDNEQFRRFVAEQRWIFAKTYAKTAPHEYVVKGKIKGDDDYFVEAARFIDENGTVAKFWKQDNSYYEYDGHYYWTFFRKPEKAKIINRCSMKINRIEERDGVKYMVRIKDADIQRE